jgi:hypothetical protein
MLVRREPLPFGPLVACAALCAVIGLFTGAESGVSSAGIVGSIAWAVFGALDAALLGILLYHAAVFVLMCIESVGSAAFMAAINLAVYLGLLG